MGRNYTTLSPATGKLLHSFPEISDQEAEEALTAAHDRFTKDWQFRPVSERALIIGRAAQIMRRQSHQFANIITLEMGKLISEAQYEVELSANILEYYATHAEQFLKDEEVPEEPGSVILSQPIGVILAIEPWNFPCYQLSRVAGPNLVAGNVIIAKHARNVPQCALAFAQILAEAGVPEGVYTNLFCSFTQINSFIDDFRVRGVTLTGSEAAGTKVAERAGKNLKKVVLELGGSDPFVVLEDANMELAIKEGAKGRMMVQGQVCVCAKRFIIVGKERGRLFLEGLVKVFEEYKAGPPEDEKTTLGPLSSEDGMTTILDQIKGAKEAGARIVTGGQRVDRPGFYVQPTIITDISQENPLFLQETFGPAASVYVVDSEIEAIELANATKFGLGASVFGTDLDRAKMVAVRIQSGMVFINSIAYLAPALPFGGVKNSGFGRELGEMGIGEFVNKKMVRTA